MGRTKTVAVTGTMTDAVIDHTTDDVTVRVTYAELAAARGVSIAAARRLTLRHRWPKQIGNDGLTRIVVPVAFVEDVGKEAAPSLDEATIAAIAEATTVAVTDAMAVVPMLQETVASLRMQLDTANMHAREADDRVREMQELLEAQAQEHREVVAALVARIPTPRRSWFPWRRQ